MSLSSGSFSVYTGFPAAYELPGDRAPVLCLIPLRAAICALLERLFFPRHYYASVRHSAAWKRAIGS